MADVRIPSHVKCSDCNGTLNMLSHFKVCSDCRRASCCDTSSNCKYCYGSSGASNGGRWLTGSTH